MNVPMPLDGEIYNNDEMSDFDPRTIISPEQVVAILEQDAKDVAEKSTSAKGNSNLRITEKLAAAAYDTIDETVIRVLTAPEHGDTNEISRISEELRMLIAAAYTYFEIDPYDTFGIADEWDYYRQKVCEFLNYEIEMLKGATPNENLSTAQIASATTTLRYLKSYFEQLDRKEDPYEYEEDFDDGYDKDY